MPKKHLENLIKEGKIKNALDYFYQLSEDNPDIHEELLILSAQFSGLQTEINGGRLSQENASTQQAKITKSLTFLKTKYFPETKTDDDSNVLEKSPEKKISTTKLAIYKVLDSKFNDENLTLFCSLFFEKVYDNFGEKQNRNTKITALLDYAKRNDLLEKLAQDLEHFLED